MDRRSFIKRTGVASLGIGLNYHKTFSKTKNGITHPVVIATWDVKKATQKAWEILLKNGDSLDAIDKVVELKKPMKKVNPLELVVFRTEKVT